MTPHQADLYAITVILHICADLVFVTGLLASALVVTALSFSPTPEVPRERRLALAMRRWHRRVTGPALVLAWLLGLGLAWGGGWSGSGWLHWKLGGVLVLSTLHGVLAGALRRLAATPPVAPALWLRASAPIIAAVAAAIVWLVLLKPF